MTNGSLQMPITAEPYKHQQEAFDFSCEKFGILDGEEAGGDDN